MSQVQIAFRRPDRSRARRGFTLLELVVSIAVIAVLVGVLFPAVRSVRASGDLARELSAARQLMTAYRNYAYDHRGIVMPGYYKPDGMPSLPVYDESGNDLSLEQGGATLVARYPWRLAPYLDYNLRGLYLDPLVLENFDAEGLAGYVPYLISFFPSLGLNAFFVGGSTADEGGVAAYHGPSETFFGKFYVTRLSEVRRPAQLITFASARSTADEFGGDKNAQIQGRDVVEGRYAIVPPYVRERLWVDNYGDATKARDFGYLSLRHSGRTAVAAFFDGHADTLDEQELQDMRRWSHQATDPDWVLEPRSP